MTTTSTRRPAAPPAWIAALACFVVAGATGLLFRMGMATVLPFNLTYENVRHAHSHLMYFGWVTPALMLLIGAHLSTPLARRIARWTLWLAGLAYGPFLLYGYGPAVVGSVRLPLSVILATLNLFAWYAFAFVYWQHRASVPQPPRRFWDAAVGLLILASLGAWGLGLVQALRPENPFWFAAALHLFLDLFANGWLLLALLGFAVHSLAPTLTVPLRWGRRLLVVGLPFTFLLSIPTHWMPVGLRWVAAAGALGAAAGLGAVLYALAPALLRPADDVRRPRDWVVPLGSIGLVGLAWAALSAPSIASWAMQRGLRILYLHVLLLGGVTLGLIAAARATWGASAAPGRAVFTGSVLGLLATLLPLTGVWPRSWMGDWVVPVAAVGASLPVLAALGVIIRLLLPTPNAPETA